MDSLNLSLGGFDMRIETLPLPLPLPRSFHGETDSSQEQERSEGFNLHPVACSSSSVVHLQSDDHHVCCYSESNIEHIKRCFEKCSRSLSLLFRQDIVIVITASWEKEPNCVKQGQECQPFCVKSLVYSFMNISDNGNRSIKMQIFPKKNKKYRRVSSPSIGSTGAPSSPALMSLGTPLSPPTSPMFRSMGTPTSPPTSPLLKSVQETPPSSPQLNRSVKTTPTLPLLQLADESVSPARLARTAWSSASAAEDSARTARSSVSDDDSVRTAQFFASVAPANHEEPIRFKKLEKQCFDNYLQGYEKHMLNTEVFEEEFEPYLQTFKREYIGKFKRQKSIAGLQNLVKQDLEKEIDNTFNSRRKMLHATWKRVTTNPETRQKVRNTWQHVRMIMQKLVRRPPESWRNKLIRMHETRWLERLDRITRYGKELFEDHFPNWQRSSLEENKKRPNLCGVSFFDWLEPRVRAIASEGKIISVVEYPSVAALACYELCVSGGKFSTNRDPIPHTSGGEKAPHIFVVSSTGKRYMTVHDRGRSQHSSMSRGEPIIGGGALLFSQGELTRIFDKSGHFPGGGDVVCEMVNYLQHIKAVNMKHVDVVTGYVEQPWDEKRYTSGGYLLVSKKCYKLFLNRSAQGLFWGNFFDWLEFYSEFQSKDDDIPASVMAFMRIEKFHQKRVRDAQIKEMEKLQEAYESKHT